MTFGWVLGHDVVSTTIPGANPPKYIRNNFKIKHLLSACDKLMIQLETFYCNQVQKHIQLAYLN